MAWLRIGNCGDFCLLLLSMAAFTALLRQVESVDSKQQIEARLFGIQTGNPLELYTNRKGDKLNLHGIHFNTCGWNNNSLVLHKFQNRHNSKGDIILDLSFSTDIDIDGPLKMSIKLLKRVGNIHIEVPCLYGVFGSCTFPDLCRFGQDTCPLTILDYQGFPCRCPIKRGMYRLQNAVFPLPRIPNVELLRGDYIVTVTLGNKIGTFSCFNFFVNIDIFKMQRSVTELSI